MVLYISKGISINYYVSYLKCNMSKKLHLSILRIHNIFIAQWDGHCRDFFYAVVNIRGNYENLACLCFDEFVKFSGG